MLGGTISHYWATSQLERVQNLSLLFDARKGFLLITFSILIHLWWKKINHVANSILYWIYISILEFCFIFILISLIENWKHTVCPGFFISVFSATSSWKNSQVVKKINASRWSISYYVILILSNLIVDMFVDLYFKRCSNQMKIGWIIKNSFKNH